MNVFDVVGPVMVGPSSSHTAGAVRIGLAARKLMGEEMKDAEILLHGSFLATGHGHGTDLALVAGLMGLAVDDERIRKSFLLAKRQGMSFRFGAIDLGDDVHPNSVKLVLESVSGKRLEVVASSVGGGRIWISRINGMKAGFSGEYHTLIVHNQDRPGCVANVTSMLHEKGVNSATMQVYRSGRGGHAVMVIECDDEVPRESLERLEHLDGVESVTYYSPA